MDEFSEKFQKAFDLPPSFSENHIANFLSKFYARKSKLCNINSLQSRNFETISSPDQSLQSWNFETISCPDQSLQSQNFETISSPDQSLESWRRP